MKIIAAVVAGAIAVASLTACGSSGNNSSGNGGFTATDANDGVVVVVSGQHADPSETGYWYLSMMNGPWDIGGQPPGPEVCQDKYDGQTWVLYDPNNTGDAAADCTALSADWETVTYPELRPAHPLLRAPR